MAKRLLAVVALVVLLLGVSAAGCGGDSPSSVLEEFTYAQADNDCEKIIDLLTEESRGLFSMATGTETDPVEACKQTLAASPQEVEITNFETIEENIDGDRAEVKFSISGNVGGEELTQEETITMVKEDGGWKVSLLGT